MRNTWAGMALLSLMMDCREKPSASEVLAQGRVEPTEASTLDGTLDAMPKDWTAFSVIRHPVPLVDAMSRGVLHFDGKATAPVPVLAPAWPDQVATVVEADHFELTKGVLVAQTGTSGLVVVFTARDADALAHLAKGFGIENRFPTACGPLSGDSTRMMCTDDASHAQAAHDGKRERERIEKLLPNVPILEAPIITSFPDASSKHGAFVVAMRAGAVMRPFGMKVLVAD